VLPVSSEVDDTAFASSARGTLYVVATRPSNHFDHWELQAGQAFGSASGLSTIDLKTGQATPFASGVKTPKDLLFVPADGGNDDGGNVNSGRHH
jgi:hypothetical protein